MRLYLANGSTKREQEDLWKQEKKEFSAFLQQMVTDTQQLETVANKQNSSFCT